MFLFFFLQFIKISGGLQGGAEPPAFQQAERQRMEKEEKEKKMRDSNLDNHHIYEKRGSIHVCHQLTFCLFTFFFCSQYFTFNQKNQIRLDSFMHYMLLFV